MVNIKLFLFLSFVLCVSHGATVLEEGLMTAFATECLTNGAQFGCLNNQNQTICVDGNFTYMKENCVLAIGPTDCNTCTQNDFTWCQYDLIDVQCLSASILYINNSQQSSFCTFGYSSCPIFDSGNVTSVTAYNSCPFNCPLITDIIQSANGEEIFF